MQSDDFLQKVDATKASWGGQSKEQQHAALLTLILEGQMDTIEGLGYEGEAGYVRLQAQLMEHANDPIITSNTQAATMTGA